MIEIINLSQIGVEKMSKMVTFLCMCKYNSNLLSYVTLCEYQNIICVKHKS